MKRILLTLLILFCSFNSFSQQELEKDVPKPKIGLVLSGGGAKGLAHIGVLKVLEQAGVKVSFIGGTSMGAVIGGLYATGYSATQIDSIFKNTDFDELLKDFVPRSSKSFYEKRNDEMYAISLPFKKLKIGIPTALSKGMYNYNLLTRLTHNVRHVRDFSNLPIPFLCIATNIVTGEEVLLNKGYLPQAMLASSAFPTLFSPVEIDGKLLVDGGVTNNYPIDQVKKMGADIIIGVDVQDDLKDKNGLSNATKILVQISNIQMIERMKQKIAETDIYIKPDINGYGLISFDDGDVIIRRGEDAAFSVYEMLKNLSTKEVIDIKNKRIKTNQDSLFIKKVTINKLKNYTNTYVFGKLGFKSKINYVDLKKGIDNLSATQNFSSISYTIDKNESNDNLNIKLIENPIKTYLKFGLHYDELYKSAVLVNVTQKKILFKNDVALFDIILGDKVRYNLDYYIDNGFYWSFGFKSKYNHFEKNTVSDFSRGMILKEYGINSININYHDFSNQAYLQTVFFQKFLIGAGLESKFLKIQSEALQNSNQIIENSHYLSVFGYLKYDSLDNKYFPKKGIYFTGDMQSFGYSSNYTQSFEPFSIAKGELGFAKTFANKYTFKCQSEAGFPIGKQSINFFNFVLGGYGFNMINNFKHFYGYDFLSLSANSYIKSVFTFDYEIIKKNHVNVSANIANIEDNLFVNGNWFSKPKHNGYAIGYGLETILGPIEIKYTWSPETRKNFVWFNVGFWF